MASINDLTEKAKTILEFCQRALWPMVNEFNIRYKIDYTQLLKVFYSAPFFILWIALSYSTHTSDPFLGINIFAIKKAVLIFGIMTFGWGLSFYGIQSYHREVALRALKGEIKKRALQCLDPSFQYSQEAVFPEEEFIQCGLFRPYDTATAEDRFAGKIGNTDFSLVEVRAYKIQKTRNSKGHTSTTYIPIFLGILLKAEFNKNFSGHTIVQSDYAEKRFGFLGRSLQRFQAKNSDFQLVELENPQFESSFKVRSTDPVQARYILTPSFMERLVKLKDSFNADIQLSFYDNAVLIAIPRSLGFFEFHSGIDHLSSSVDGMLKELIEVLRIVDELDLNTRIWNKPSREEGA